MRFADVTAVSIPEGIVERITRGDTVLWEAAGFRYVSMGDSIAAGHSIDENWASDYGEGSQYGKNGNTETFIVPGCYTALIRDELPSRASGRTVATSFARSGDTVADLIAKLSHDGVAAAVRRAKLVTICIGANDILATAMSHLDDYITAGDLSVIGAEVEANLARLDNDADAGSYKALLDRLTELNPTATIVFTTVYNPYRYLWIEEGHHGFFEPLMDAIPDMEFGGVDFDSFIKDSILGTPIVQQLFDRVNGLGDWAEAYITRLNAILRAKVAAHENGNIAVADTKALFDCVPDREVAAPYHYNDLVSVEYTRGYDYHQMNWGRMYGDGGTATSYWTGMFSKHGLDITAIAEEFVSDTATKVVTPDVDPHPETRGHYMLFRSFEDALGWQALDRHAITYAANGGSGSTAATQALGVDGLAAFVNVAACGFSPAEGYYFTGWVDAAGAAYAAGQQVGLTGDLALSAQWSNIYYIRYDAYAASDSILTSSDTGKMDYYALVVGGEWKDKFGKFSNDSIYYQVPYGTQVIVVANDSAKNEQSYVARNGERVTEKGNSSMYTFTLTGNVRVRFEANKYYSGITLHEYWVGHVYDL